MADEVTQGSQFTGVVLYRDGTNALVDPDNPYMDLLDPDGNVVAAHNILVRDDLGTYHSTFIVPIEAEVGTWTMIFYGTIDGSQVAAPDEFDVTPIGDVSPIIQATQRIRMLLGERIPVGGADTDTRFLDSEIMMVYYVNDQDLYKTMAEMWLAKAAIFTELVDMSESGTTRSLSQMQRAATVQANAWQTRVIQYESQWTATYRVAGKGIDIYDVDRHLPFWTVGEPCTVRSWGRVLV